MTYSFASFAASGATEVDPLIVMVVLAAATDGTPSASAAIGEFAVSAEVYDHTTQAIVEADSFFCEGLIPGDGFNCTGIAHAGKDVKTSFETNEPVCSDTEVTDPLRLQVVVSDANGATAGPFRLRGPAKCPKPDLARPAGRRGGKHRHGRGTHKKHTAARRHAAR